MFTDYRLDTHRKLTEKPQFNNQNFIKPLLVKLSTNASAKAFLKPGVTLSANKPVSKLL